MVLDFGALPPEINSAQMYAGPGSGTMLAAAQAWQELAGELSTAAVACGSTVADLTSGLWTGAASMSMAAAVAPYLAWMNATAAQAGQAAGQAAAAAAAFETAFAATVPPPVIAANRSLLASLVATNLLGQNTPAIAATEAHYGQMWAQDAAAMYGYAAASSAATQVTPFTPPPQTTEQAGPAAQAVANPAGAELQTAISTTPQVLQGLSVPPGLAEVASSGTSEASSGSALSSLSGISSLMMPARMATMPLMMLMRMFMMGGANGASKGAAGLATSAGGAGPAASGALTGGLGSASLTSIVSSGPTAAGSMGGATSIGALSVPTAWTGASTAMSPATAALPGSAAGAAPSVGAGAAAVPPMMPITNMAGRGGLGGPAAQYDFRPTVLARSPIGG